MKRYLPYLVLAFGVALLGIARAVTIDGTDSSGQTKVVQVGYNQVSVTNAITAFAGGGQTSAVLLTSSFNRVTVVATANDSVKLPLCQVGGGVGLSNSIGVQIMVSNADSTDSLDVFPSSGDTINPSAQNAKFAVTAGKTAMFVCAVSGIWSSMLGA